MQPLPVLTLAFGVLLIITACNPGNVIEDLGTLGGDSLGLGINAVGNVSGGSFISSSSHGGGYHAFRYVDGLGMIDAGALQPGNVGEAAAINAGGLMVGGSMGGDGVTRAFRASATLNLTELPSFGGEFSYAWDINDQGVITGEASNDQLQTHAVIWTSTDKRDLGTLGGMHSGGMAINELGQVAGHSMIREGNAIRAFRFTEGTGMVNLGVLSGGSTSRAFGINNSGQVVGESETQPVLDPGFSARLLPFSGRHAFLWTEGTGMMDLGHLGGGTSSAIAISNTGIVVGSSTLGSTATHAFRWTQNEGMVDLNSLIPSSSGWILIQAFDVNDRGQITGFGTHNGALRAFRFNPAGLPKATQQP